MASHEPEITQPQTLVQIDAKIEALRAQRDFFRAIDMDVAADMCEQTVIGWEGSRGDLERALTCGCYACIGNMPTGPIGWLTVGMTVMIVCSVCGNKRCPHGTDHRHACTGSNEPEQDGSRYGGISTPPAEDALDAEWASKHYTVTRSHGCDDPAPECVCGSPLTPHRRVSTTPA